MFGNRLRQAIDLRYSNVLEAARDLEAHGVSGGSYSQLRRYLDGRSAPSLEFVAEVSRHLEVRPAWLGFGEGPMLHFDAVSLGGALLTEWTTGAADSILKDLVRSLVVSQPSGWSEPSDRELMELASSFEALVFELRHALRGDRPEDRAQDTAFICSILAACRGLVPAPGQGIPVSEVLRRLGFSDDQARDAERTAPHLLGVEAAARVARDVAELHGIDALGGMLKNLSHADAERIVREMEDRMAGRDTGNAPGSRLKQTGTPSRGGIPTTADTREGE